MGSYDRLNYTAFGDVVNSALRLEQINKLYGTQLMVSENVYQRCYKQFYFRPVDAVNLKGQVKTTAIYELVAAKIGPKELLATPDQITLCELSFAAYQAAYQSGNRDKALKLFNEILETFPHDAVAKYHIERLENA